jgi:hypothetical protein
VSVCSFHLDSLWSLSPEVKIQYCNRIIDRGLKLISGLGNHPKSAYDPSEPPLVEIDITNADHLLGALQAACARLEARKR